MKLLVIVSSLLVLCGCQTVGEADRDALRQSLSAEEQMFADVVLHQFDVARSGEMAIGILHGQVPATLLRYLNRGSLRFVAPAKSLPLQPLFYLRFVDYFHPDYAYVQVEDAGPFSQKAFGYVFRRTGEWVLVDWFAFDDWTQELDRAAYVKNKIVANQTSTANDLHAD